MRGSDQIDVVTAAALEREHHPRQGLGVDRLALAGLAYAVVLTEYTAQITIREEYRARSVSSSQGFLLAKVRSVA